MITTIEIVNAINSNSGDDKKLIHHNDVLRKFRNDKSIFSGVGTMSEYLDKHGQMRPVIKLEPRDAIKLMLSLRSNKEFSIDALIKCFDGYESELAIKMLSNIKSGNSVNN